MREPIPWCWDRLHHFYIGLAITIIGYILKNKWIMLLGIFGIVDDILEHTVTADTPLRIIYENTIKESMPACPCDESKIGELW